MRTIETQNEIKSYIAISNGPQNVRQQVHTCVISNAIFQLSFSAT